MTSIDKYEFQVGDRVRSYDFPGNFECYVEGVITSVESYLMTILTDVECWQGERNPSKRVVRTHVEKMPSWLTRVSKVA